MHAREQVLDRLMAGALAMVLGIGIVCQFVQSTDPTPPLAYFTVDSAVGATLLSVSRLLRGRSSFLRALFDRAWGAVSSGVVFSGVVYAGVIAPSNPGGAWFQPHDDLWVRTATVLLHVLGPLLVLADRRLCGHSVRHPWRTSAIWTWWPASYLAVMVAFAVVGAAHIPYPFLRPSEVTGGWPAVVVAGLILQVTFVVVARLTQLVPPSRDRR